jgi:hypothetical protein
MITTSLMGGLGNYMFQISAAYTIAKDLRTDAIFDLSRTGQSQRHINNYLDNIFSKVKFGTPIPKYIFNERGFSYDPIPAADDLYLSGYFQSEKYFNKYAEDIRELFSCKDTENKLRDHISQIEYTCSIHVRRGDYLKYPNKHSQSPTEYYDTAISLVKEQNPNATFLIFSDDIQWCKNHFIGNEYTFIEGFEDWEDLILMSICDANIITNSTFSWWAAWLGETPGKLIIAPEKWFGPEGPQDQQDIIPERWTKLR